jgi:SAM-dependent methyltransferase
VRSIAGILKRTVRFGVRRALSIARVRGLVEGELARSARSANVVAPPPLPAFTDRHGVTHPLDPTLRDRLKPNWREMCDPGGSATVPTDEGLRGRVRKAAKAVTEAERVLEATAGTGIGGRILEIGCYDGSAAFELSRRPGTQVVASDLARYYVVQRPGQPEDEAVAAEEVALAVLRERARAVARVPAAAVRFVEDDITASSLEPESFDLIVSFEVLEHVQRPRDALAAMTRLLRPGGVMYHDYNPFFSAIGGHSLATLDLPWGHARLDAADVERYLRDIRPAEADQALRFYRESLNRMTQTDLRADIAAVGLELLALVPWNQRSLLPDIRPQVLAEVRRSYPTATIEDLLGTFVAVVARRPAAPS